MSLPKKILITHHIETTAVLHCSENVSNKKSTPKYHTGWTDTTHYKIKDIQKNEYVTIVRC